MSKSKNEIQIIKIHKPGIYAIHNKRNNKYYIGSTNDLCNRTKTHRYNLNNWLANKRIIQDLCSGCNQTDFEFIALEIFENGEVTEAQLRKREAYFIKKYNSDTQGYNDPNHRPMPNPNKWNEKVYCRNTDTISILLPKGTKERIQARGETVNGYINRLILADLERLENKAPFE